MQPRLRFLHSRHLLSGVKLTQFRQLSTEQLKFSLRPGEPGALKTRPDGTVLDGHHRLAVLVERAEDVEILPREILKKRDDEH